MIVGNLSFHFVKIFLSSEILLIFDAIGEL